MDELDQRRLKEIQEGVDKLLKQTNNTGDSRGYLRGIIRRQTIKITQQTDYIRQLENELRLRGLE